MCLEFVPFVGKFFLMLPSSSFHVLDMKQTEQTMLDGWINERTQVSTSPFIYCSIDPSINLSRMDGSMKTLTHLSNHQHISSLIYHSICYFNYTSINSSTNYGWMNPPNTNSSVHSSTHNLVYQLVHQCIVPSIYPRTHPRIHSSIHQSHKSCATSVIVIKTARAPTFCAAAVRNGYDSINNSFPFIINISCQVNSTLSKHPGKNNCLWLPPLLLMAGRFRSRWSLTCEQYQIVITRGSFTFHSSDTWLVIYVCQLLSDVMNFCMCSATLATETRAWFWNLTQDLCGQSFSVFNFPSNC